MEPLSEPHETATRCPACGVETRPGARFCASCGAEIASASLSTSADASASPVRTVETAMAQNPMDVAGSSPAAPEALAAAAEETPAAVEEAPAAATQVCQWCGASNPADATQCSACHATFARPDQDAALRRDLDERLRQEQVANEMYENRRGFWRRFVR